MKVWILHTEYAYDSDVETIIEVFSTYDKARQKFESAIADEKENDHLFEKDDIVVDEWDDYFGVYEDGHYCEDHLLIEIIEKEVY